MIHRQHLVAKNQSNCLYQLLRYVIFVVNKIRSNFLNDRLFAQLCKDNDKDFYRLILHTEVRWLSKDVCFSRFWNIFVSIIEFLEEKDVDLRSKLLQFKTDITLHDRFIRKIQWNQFANSRRRAQFDNKKSIIFAFLKKLTL